MAVPCGKCIGCKLEHSRQRALRCVHEAKMHDDNCWVTLTYDDDNVPYAGSLVKSHLQDFIKRLRRRIEPTKISFFACGEYGEKTERPHYHVCIFGYDFPDKRNWRSSSSGGFLYRSDELERIWHYGNSEIGELSFETAAYTARYCTKKVSGEKAFMHYTKILLDGTMVEIEPEFAHMSTRPAIGASHYERYWEEIYPADECIINGKRSVPTGS